MDVVDLRLNRPTQACFWHFIFFPHYIRHQTSACHMHVKACEPISVLESLRRRTGEQANRRRRTGEQANRRADEDEQTNRRTDEQTKTNRRTDKDEQANRRRRTGEQANRRTDEQTKTNRRTGEQTNRRAGRNLHETVDIEAI